jgi:hypothetical protein
MRFVAIVCRRLKDSALFHRAIAPDALKHSVVWLKRRRRQRRAARRPALEDAPPEKFAKMLTLAFLAIVEPIVANHLVVAAEHFRGIGEIEFAAGRREGVRARRATGRCAGRPGGP